MTGFFTRAVWLHTCLGGAGAFTSRQNIGLISQPSATGLGSFWPLSLTSAPAQKAIETKAESRASQA